ncbi:MAG: single-stranded-DNA-specific exonuclease RecJ [Proteobacteria bacterium]|nr:single-stranded-DNA-specific exonuclease RecJ [Pseudomonadota bacterium]
MKPRWLFRKPDPSAVRRLAGALSCHPAVAAALVNRRLDDPDRARAFLSPSLSELPLPCSMADMDAAVLRLAVAVETGEGILVFGDYDADGVSATALYTEFLEECGARVAFHIPHRAEEGYGLKESHVTELAVRLGARVILTADCGVSSHEAGAAAAAKGLSLVVTDHHEPPETLPRAEAVVNPKRTDCPSGLGYLAGVGVAFFVCAHLRAALRDRGWFAKRPEPNLLEKCDLVALGTIADLVPLVGANRVLVRAGLDHMAARPRPGIAALMEVAGVIPAHVTERDVAFSLAPRINAAGRLAHAEICVELLRTTHPGAARTRALELEELNTRRREIESHLFDQALELATSPWGRDFSHSLVLTGDGWHQGVAGIAASRMASRFHRPVAILCAGRDGKIRGSARSVPGVDLVELLRANADLLVAYGGHAMAAGLEVAPESVQEFARRFEKTAAEAVRGRDLTPRLHIDWPLALNEVGPELADEIETLGPFGEGNPEPLFAGQDVALSRQRVVGRGARTMTLAQNGVQTANALSAIWFSPDGEDDLPPLLPRVCFKVCWNRFHRQKTLQLQVAGVDLETVS